METDIWPVIKWILIILLAGFIGQFGKILADELVARARARRQKGLPSGSDPAPPPPADPEDSAPSEPRLPPPLSGTAPVTLDKKSAKAMAKQIKKAAKK